MYPDVDGCRAVSSSFTFHLTTAGVQYLIITYDGLCTTRLRTIDLIEYANAHLCQQNCGAAPATVEDCPRNIEENIEVHTRPALRLRSTFWSPERGNL